MAANSAVLQNHRGCARQTRAVEELNGVACHGSGFLEGITIWEQGW